MMAKDAPEIDRPVWPPLGWTFCLAPGCGVWLRILHPTGICRVCTRERRLVVGSRLWKDIALLVGRSDGCEVPIDP